MKVDEYKEHIKEEYERLYKQAPKDERPYMHLIMWGNEGLEGYKVTQEQKDLNVLETMSLRARFNGHRNVGVYAFSAHYVVPAENITADLLTIDKVIRIY